jgi:ABC-type nitrate/sulfonate/bicarbonate transport system substrate-binding protein
VKNGHQTEIHRRWVRCHAAGAAFMAVMLATSAAMAADRLHVGKAISGAFTFTLLDVGVKEGLFQKYGLEVEAAEFAGGSKLQQAMASGSIDIGLDTGPDLSLIVKGAPVKGVAAMAGRPFDTGILVRNDGPIRTVADLKGKKLGASVVTALINYLTKELSRHQGWGPDGINLVATGSPTASLAFVKTGEVDGMAGDLGTLYNAEQNGAGHVLVTFAAAVQDFHNYVIFATDDLIATHPDEIRRFLKGWFETIAFANANKDRTIQSEAEVLRYDRTLVAKLYDTQMPMYSRDGKFDAKALAALARSYVELNLLDKEPDMTKLVTEAFLPSTAN